MPSSSSVSFSSRTRFLEPIMPRYAVSSCFARARRQTPSCRWPLVKSTTKSEELTCSFSIAESKSMQSTSFAVGKRSLFAKDGRSSVTVTAKPVRAANSASARDTWPPPKISMRFSLQKGSAIHFSVFCSSSNPVMHTFFSKAACCASASASSGSVPSTYKCFSRVPSGFNFVNSSFWFSDCRPERSSPYTLFSIPILHVLLFTVRSYHAPDYFFDYRYILSSFAASVNAMWPKLQEAKHKNLCIFAKLHNERTSKMCYDNDILQYV